MGHPSKIWDMQGYPNKTWDIPVLMTYPNISLDIPKLYKNRWDFTG